MQVQSSGWPPVLDCGCCCSEKFVSPTKTHSHWPGCRPSHPPPALLQVAAGKRTQAELEDQILYMLATATGSLLDNKELIFTLDASKTTWEEVNQSLQIAEVTAKEIEVASQQYRPCSTRAAILYFVLNDLSNIDPMYQFSLDSYNDLFILSIKNSPKSEKLEVRPCRGPAFVLFWQGLWQYECAKGG